MILLISILALYILMLCTFVLAWRKAIGIQTQHQPIPPPMLSVVVAVRNEEKNIRKLFTSFKAQTYTNFEIIVVDDHSTDGSLVAASDCRFPNVVITKNAGAGKKKALETGINLARGEIIVTTDADCEMQQHWLECIQKEFYNPKIKLAFGAVAISPASTFFAKLQALELASLVGSGAAASAIGAPIMCNGANLAFRKETFQEVNGYRGNDHIASGDDEFLMRKILERYPDGVKFTSHSEASVITTGLESFRDFVHQRLRWAGKWRHNSSRYTIALALFVFAAQVSLLLTIVLLFFGQYYLFPFLIVRLVLEFVLIKNVCRFSGTRWSWLAFLVLQFCYPIYAISIGVLSNFIKPRWKGRPVVIAKPQL